MLAPETFKALSWSLPREQGMPDQASNRLGLSRLFAAAVVSRQFRDELLHQPESALANGYLGQTFSLTGQEQALIVSIRAESLPDLARQVNRALKRPY